MGTKMWWNLVKEQQGLARDDIIPPLNKSDGTTAFTNKEKAEELASFFCNKMTVPQPNKIPPKLIRRTLTSATKVDIDESRLKTFGNTGSANHELVEP